MKNIDKFGFTLAEVLITLGIIGIVAALTLPSLISKYQEKEMITRLKQTYSIMEQALGRAISENGYVNEWGYEKNFNGSVKVYETIKPYLKILEYCGNDARRKCFSSNTYKYLNGELYNTITVTDHGPKFRLINGAAVYIYTTYSSCETNPDGLCAYMFIDINGKAKPNTSGLDTFGFIIKRNKIEPLGQSRYPFKDYCRDKDTSQSIGCTAWVLYNENMDYLRCNDLSWEEKTSCK